MAIGASTSRNQMLLAVGYHGFFHGPGFLDGSIPAGREDFFWDPKAQLILGRTVAYTQPVEMAG